MKISIEGHTDNVGAAAANKTLSDNRARSVMNAVVGGGIAANRLSAAGFGADKPIADNRSEDGRAKNRRVELVKR
jgi:outer membrane protein OmpA-like peptidoglycan-associated protein